LAILSLFSVADGMKSPANDCHLFFFLSSGCIFKSLFGLCFSSVCYDMSRHEPLSNLFCLEFIQLLESELMFSFSSGIFLTIFLHIGCLLHSFFFSS
jgi:hypothetical protein